MRKRNYTVTIRMNKAEYDLFQSKVKESGRTQQEVVIKAERTLLLSITHIIFPLSFYNFRHSDKIIVLYYELKCNTKKFRNSLLKISTFFSTKIQYRYFAQNRCVFFVEFVSFLFPIISSFFCDSILIRPPGSCRPSEIL